MTCEHVCNPRLKNKRKLRDQEARREIIERSKEREREREKGDQKRSKEGGGESVMYATSCVTHVNARRNVDIKIRSDAL